MKGTVNDDGELYEFANFMQHVFQGLHLKTLIAE